MPTYVYKFLDSGETIEVQQSFSDESLTVHVHPESGELKPVKKVFQPVGVTFKGSGFFKTDNRGGKATTKPSSDSGSASSTSDSTSESKSDSGSGSSTTSKATSESTAAPKPSVAASTGPD